MNNKTLRNILIVSAFTAAAGAIAGYIVSRRAKVYLDNDNDDVEYISSIDIDIPIDILMDEEE